MTATHPRRTSMPEKINRRSLLSAAAASGVLTRAAPAFGARGERRTRESEQRTATPGKRLFRLGMVTYDFAPEWDLATLLRRCKAAGYAGIEPRTTHKHGIEPSLSP